MEIVYLCKQRFKPIDCATDEACRAFLKHHEEYVLPRSNDPECLLDIAIEYCNTLSASSNVETVENLHAYHLDPYFFWAPPDARYMIFGWAQNAFTNQLAAYTQPFLELPEDCAGDVLEYLDTNMTREDSLYYATECATPAAHAWVRDVLAAGVSLSTGMKFRSLHMTCSIKKASYKCHYFRCSLLDSGESNL